MKKNFFYFAALALSLGMVSCSSDDADFAEQTAQDGTPAVVTLTPEKEPVLAINSKGTNLIKTNAMALGAAAEDEIVITNEDGSVEVNLTLNDVKEDGDWKESHLTVHVRDTTNFTVFMPIKEDYYLKQDDMMIVKDHKNFTYKEDTKTVTTTVGLNKDKVTLTVTYRANGIEVSSVGITAQAIKDMRRYYDDGLTFEVKNYYRVDEENSLTRAEIKEMLDKSYITFDREPKFYVNAFGKYGDVVDQWASTVKPQNMGVYNDAKVQENASTLYIYAKK